MLKSENLFLNKLIMSDQMNNYFITCTARPNGKLAYFENSAISEQDIS